jgi:hypothetical protein
MHLLTYILGSSKAVTEEQSSSPTTPLARKPGRVLFEPQEESQVSKPSPKKQKTKATEPKAGPVIKEKTTLRKFLGISKEEARKQAKYHMSMASKLIEDSDEE